MTLYIIRLPSKDYDVGFHTETCKMFNVPKHISEEEKIKLDLDIIENNKNKVKDIERIFLDFLDTYGDYKKPNFELYLMVSQKCNMRCKYCYASHGTYGDEGMMCFSTAKKIIEAFYENFSGISKIVFFGGEPLLNFSLIKQVCEFTSEYCNERHFKIPMFAIVTNGTIYSDEIKKFLNQFKIALTVSIDGQKEINDQLRVFPDGKGSSELVLENISKFNYAREYPLMIEMTFTKKHIENNFMYSTLIDYVVSLGADEIIISPVLLSPNNPLYESLNIDEKAVKEVCEDISCGVRKIISSLALLSYPRPIYNFLMPLAIEIMKQQHTIRFCPAATSRVAIDWRGNIYPCQMFIGKKEFYMGNICNGDFPNDQFFKINRYFLEYVKNKIKGINTECKNCWIRYLCEECPARNIIINGNINIPVKTSCIFKKIEIEALLKELLNIREDKIRYKHFLTNLVNYFKRNRNINKD